MSANKKFLQGKSVNEMLLILMKRFKNFQEFTIVKNKKKSVENFPLLVCLLDMTKQVDDVRKWKLVRK